MIRKKKTLAPKVTLISSGCTWRCMKNRMVSIALGDSERDGEVGRRRGRGDRDGRDRADHQREENQDVEALGATCPDIASTVGAADEIQRGKRKDPHQIDEVPIQAAISTGCTASVRTCRGRLQAITAMIPMPMIMF